MDIKQVAKPKKKKTYWLSFYQYVPVSFAWGKQENCDRYMNAKSGSVNVTTKNVLNLKGFVTTPQLPQDSVSGLI